MLLENLSPLVHCYPVLLPKLDPCDKVRRIIFLPGVASLVMGVAKLFGVKGNRDGGFLLAPVILL